MRPLLYLALLASVASGAAAAAPGQVTVAGGRLQGAVAGGVASYRAIPYAAPPVGPLRWKPPQAAARWTGVRAAVKDGPVCPQPADKYGIFAPGTQQSEDCLTLNVFAPVGAKRAPVMLWLHGGGHMIGSGSQPGYDGSAFAKAGVILVSVNYRLGLLGYFAHPALTAEAGATAPLGAYGDMDQQAALRWVHDNIAKFGGDPGNVTLFGESAGGRSTLYLLANPERSRGLVARAIVESGGYLSPRNDLAIKEGEGVRYAQGFGLAATASAADLRALPADRIAQAQGRFGPFPDGRWYRSAPAQAFAAGTQLKVPIVIGSNTDEGGLATMLGTTPAAMAALTGDLAAAAPVYGVTDRARLSRLAAGDAMIVAPARYIARQAAAAGSPAWLYYFGYVPAATRQAKPDTPGAGHGMEVPFVFGNAAQAVGGATPTAADSAVATRINGCWIAFAKTGTPCAGTVDWPRYDAGDRSLMFDGEATVQTGYRKAELDYQERRLFAPAAATGADPAK